MLDKISLLEFGPEELKEELASLELPNFRFAQIPRWYFARKAGSISEMTDLPLTLREKLAEKYTVFAAEMLAHRKSDDGTEKLLLQWPDGHRVECVLLRDDRNHRTACISIQVGCAMGCLFCASGLDGFVRNLTRGEMIEQILRLNQLLPKTERLTHLVIMGTGEPLLNLPSLLSALNAVTSQENLDISKRRVTISTVGLPQGIEKLADAEVSYRLAVSLHAPNDVLRNRIVPQNRHTGIQKIMAASDYFFEKTGRRVTFEYVLIDSLNDSREHAQELTALLRNRTAIVNLIPFNPVQGLPYKTPSPTATRDFAETLQNNGIDMKIRFRKGNSINAACGQLRRSWKESKE
ncbi:MAG: 23S rRNA (adenine(2503)-C(2))-methyltransferase RlmN [Planctomycetaceae bacterium]|jgi:23S rRNA (adenine2503-C2)-methyltransferase|nr:23S rRNA (adenine(2503)-C(2))-methyltransferase RlmN [Planctomycetaceae bacterium]